MDTRYKPVIDYVVDRFADHLGERLKSVFINGSVARGDAVWGVSDIDLVLAFEAPNKEDTALKREVEGSVLDMSGGDALVIERIGMDRLNQMSEGKRANCLYAYRNDIEVVYGQSPKTFLPENPNGQELVRLIAPLIRKDGDAVLNESIWGRKKSRHFAKRILHALTLPIIAEGKVEFIRPLEISSLPLPIEIRNHMPYVLEVFCNAPELSRSSEISVLKDAWKVTWDHIETCEIYLHQS